MTTIRLPKVSLKRCFLLTLGFALLVIFGLSLSSSQFGDKTFWKTRDIQPSEIGHAKIKADWRPNSLSDSDQRLLAKSATSTTTTTTTTTTAQSPVIIRVDGDYDQSLLSEGGDDNDEAAESELLADGPQLQHSSKPWFFVSGKRQPVEVRRSRKTNRRLAKLMPEEDRWSDRITNQLMFVPPGYEEYRETGHLKTILLYNGLGPWGRLNEGRDIFISSKCPVNTCKITADRSHANTADLILYKDHYVPPRTQRTAKQLYMLYFLECPYHTQHVKVPNVFNWTSTYRKDSDIVAPYEKWEYFDSRVKQVEQDRNYALNKTKKVAWFVSNCGARNGRLQYAHELGKHIQVDIYGSCGNYKCSRSTAFKCFDILDHDYKFYLAFENSNCKDYITEKFFVNALSRNILPIVMGARPEDYVNAAPYRSYIHVDEFSSHKELADYLHILDQNDELYNSYFKWKGTGEFINTYYWCRVCAMLHDEVAVSRGKWYEDVNEWWRGSGVCSNGSWRNFQARKEPMSDD